MGPSEHEMVRRFVAARRDRSVAVLEGYHAVKHAVRFGASLDEVVVAADTPPSRLPPELDEAGIAPMRVPDAVFDRLVPSRPPLALVALAPRRAAEPAAVLTRRDDRRAVLLERPTHLGNVGAVVRVAAAAGAAGVVVVGGADPWAPAAIRGAAGLQYAVPVAATRTLPDLARPLVAFDPAGTDLFGASLPAGAVLAFGTERRGLSDDLRSRADLVVAIPMRPRVSSLNLATAVAVGLYCQHTVGGA